MMIPAKERKEEESEYICTERLRLFWYYKIKEDSSQGGGGGGAA
jgi:hypothetical protein